MTSDKARSEVNIGDVTGDIVGSIIAGLKSTRIEEFQPALAAAEKLLADEPAMGPATAALLLAIQQEIDPIDGSSYPALNQVYGLLVDQIFDHWPKTQQIPEILAWYDEQTEYDGIVFNRQLDSISRRHWAEDTRILMALFSDNPSAVKHALQEVDSQFFYTQVGYPNVSFLIALKAMLDKRDSLGDALVDEARKLLMKGIFRNQGFLDYNGQDVKLLVDWYYQQEDCQPLKRYPKPISEDADWSLASEAVTEALLHKDITDVCNQYRDCLSYLWNTFFRHDDNEADLFQNLEGLVFASLVRNRGVWLGPDYVLRGQLGYLPDLRVRPKLTSGPLSILWLPDPSLHYNRWEKTSLTADTIDIRFKDYFDWDNWGYRTWEYIEGWVVEAPDRPELAQKAVLIEARQANIIFDQSRVVDIPEYSIETVLNMPLPRSRLPVFHHYAQVEDMAGTDVTAICDRYRECARHLWQTYFRQPDSRAPSFDVMNRELFSAMVLAHVGRAADSVLPGVTPIPYLRVVPNIGSRPNQETVAVYHRRRIPGVRSDDWQEVQLTADTAELWFKGYWDRDVDQADHQDRDFPQYRTWRYIQARVARAPDQPELTGEDVIIEPSIVTIVFNPDWSGPG